VGISGHDDPAVPIPGQDFLPDDIKGRKEGWIDCKIYDGKADIQPKRRGRLPFHHQWNGATKMFENYMFHVTEWMLKVGMGYMILPTLSKSYCTGNW
jgi:hypothetical protein